MSASDPTEPPEPAELARQFLDLWQRQVAMLAGEGGLAAMFARLADLTMGQSDGPAAEAANGRKTRTAAAGAAPGDGIDDLRGLARRVAACEARLARLEQAAQAHGNGARPPPRRRRS